MDCVACGEGDLIPISASGRLAQVASDSRPWAPGATLAECGACGLVQKVRCPELFAEIAEIYNSYALYAQGAGAVDQPVFDPMRGTLAGRCDQILGAATAHIALPPQPTLLDVGSGVGALLAAARRMFEPEQLYACESNAKLHGALARIVPADHVLPDIGNDPGRRFDLVTAVHVLEHVEAPVAFLQTMARRLSPGGRIVIQIPNHLENPFDLVVADHLTHFSPATLRALAARAGLAVEVLSGEVVRKEIFAVLCRDVASEGIGAGSGRARSGDAERLVGWLADFARLAVKRAEARTGRLGVFGTSIGATWLWQYVAADASFFVDEDRTRIGHWWQGRRILHPESVEPGSVVLVPLAPTLARTVVPRWASRPIEWIMPPDI